MNIKIYFDGACHNLRDLSSPIGMGMAVFVDGVYDEEYSLAWGFSVDQLDVRGTSNVAEWHGCVQAFKTAKEFKKAFPQCKIEVYSDSQIITNQFNGTYAVNNPIFAKFKNKAHTYSHGSGCREVIWIPREMNKEADKLSKIGLNTAKLNSNGSTSN